jgi:hypothetical protein
VASGTGGQQQSATQFAIRWPALSSLDLDQPTPPFYVRHRKNPMNPLRSSEATRRQIISLSVQGQVSMSDDPKDVIEAAIRSAFVSYPREDEPDWRSPHWIKPEECAHLANVVIRELETKGFRIVKKAT